MLWMDINVEGKGGAFAEVLRRYPEWVIDMREDVPVHARYESPGGTAGRAAAKRSRVDYRRPH